MVTLGNVKRWNAGVLEEVFQTVKQRQGVLISCGDDFHGTLPIYDWQGPAAEAATSAHQTLIPDPPMIVI